jgi:hypothetical protein
LSHPLVQVGRMKNAHLFPEEADSGEVIALFGDAKLVKTIDSKYELRGGSKGDHIAAQEWVSKFMHEMVLTFQT